MNHMTTNATHTLTLIPSPLIPSRLYILPYWSNTKLLIFEIWALSGWAPECPNVRN